MSNISGGTQRPRRSQQTRLTEKLAPETKPRQPAMRQPKGRSQRLIEEEARRSAPPKTRGTPTGKRASAPKRKTTRKPRKGRKKRSSTFLWLLVMLISLTGTAGLLLLAAPQMLGMELSGLPTLAFVNGSIIRYDAERIANFNEAVALVNTDRIFPGVTIDGINVGGMTRADAESALGQGGVDNSSVNLHVVADAYTYDITGYDVPLYRNVSEMAAVAYAAGRGNTTALRGSGRTPLSERVATIRAMQQSPVTLQTQITYDRDAVRKIAENIAADVTCTPVNATVESFDRRSSSPSTATSAARIWMPTASIRRSRACWTWAITPRPCVCSRTRCWRT